MSRPPHHLISVLACILLVACGGGSDGDTDSADDTAVTAEATSDGTGSPATQDPDQPETGDQPSGTFTGTIAIGGITTRLSFDRVDWSRINTPFSTSGNCNPDFFGSGRWFANGFAVDDDNVAIPYNDGEDFGLVQIDLPPDTWADEQRDPPELTVDLGDDEYRIATPEEAGSSPMSWTIGDATLAGTATLVDRSGDIHTLEFEIECSGERSSSFDLDDLPDDGEGDPSIDPESTGTGTFHDGAITHDDVFVGRCIPTDDSDPRNFGVYALAEGSGSFLDVTVTHDRSFVPPGSAAEEGEEIHVDVFVSRDALGIQFERRISSDDGETWYLLLPRYDPSATPLEDASITITDTRITGEVPDLEQSWPDAGAEVASVTFDLDLPPTAVEC